MASLIQRLDFELHNFVDSFANLIKASRVESADSRKPQARDSRVICYCGHTFDKQQGKSAIVADPSTCPKACSLYIIAYYLVLGRKGAWRPAGSLG